ncbi:MAG: protein-L-isoaspartate O-methyltransferase [Candidatus Kerfeldbacteria bacterium]|nr:protein-L-isoaspartate O-methyltransferase [Candidatus Kerfeldbacteria bacterium]
MTNEDLVAGLIASGTLTTPEIMEAFRVIDRRRFVDEEWVQEAYHDYPLPISATATISQPTTVAFMLELLQVKAGDHVLDVGSGSGWTTALLSQLAGPKGSVVGVELDPELVSQSQERLSFFRFPNARIVQASEELGYPPDAPYQKILVSASAITLPQELVDQLAPSGRMVIPVGTSIIRVDKLEDTHIETEEFPGFAFVPLYES